MVLISETVKHLYSWWDSVYKQGRPLDNTTLRQIIRTDWESQTQVLEEA